MTDNRAVVATVDQYPRGYYPDVNRPGYDRYWDGQRWLDEWKATTPSVNVAYPVAYGNSAPVQQVVISQDRKRVNHLLHLVLTIFTFGLWLPVWIILAFAKS